MTFIVVLAAVLILAAAVLAGFGALPLIAIIVAVAVGAAILWQNRRAGRVGP